MKYLFFYWFYVIFKFSETLNFGFSLSVRHYHQHSKKGIYIVYRLHVLKWVTKKMMFFTILHFLRWTFIIILMLLTFETFVNVHRSVTVGTFPCLKKKRGWLIYLSVIWALWWALAKESGDMFQSFSTKIWLCEANSEWRQWTGPIWRTRLVPGVLECSIYLYIYIFMNKIIQKQPITFLFHNGFYHLCSKATVS